MGGRHRNIPLIPGPESEADFENLFAAAEPRERPPDADEAAIRDTVYREWRQVTGARRRRRTGLAVAAAVVAGIALTLALIQPPPAPPPVLVATVVHTLGDSGTQIVRGRSSMRVRDKGTELYAGSRLEVPDGDGLAVELLRGGELRLAGGTRMELIAVREFRLLAGAVYFDSGSAHGHAAEHVTIRAGGATVRDIGTRFAVGLNGATVDVRVRDGAVQIDRGGELLTAQRGERLSVAPSGEVERLVHPRHGEDWRWVDRLAAMSGDPDRRVIEVLEWASAETGYDLVFSDAGARGVADETILRGSGALDPIAALRAVDLTTRLDFRIVDGTLEFRVQEE